MANSFKKKGDRAELEVQAILRDELGVPARRALGAGRKDDFGDIHGMPDGMVIQVCNWKDVALAVREKTLECVRQMHVRSRTMGHSVFGATFIRLRSTPTAVTETAYPNWRVVLTVEQWAAMWREAQ